MRPLKSRPMGQGEKMSENRAEEMKRLRESFADVEKMCEGSAMIDDLKSRIVRTLGIIAAHVGTFDADLSDTLPLQREQYRLQVRFADKKSTVICKLPTRSWIVEMTREDERGKDTLPIFLVIPIFQRLPFILKSALSFSP